MYKTIIVAAAVLLINGHEPHFIMAQSAATFDPIDHLPAFDGAMFAGNNCNLCTNSNWDVRSKGIKE